jgi:hypothetical protein
MQTMPMTGTTYDGQTKNYAIDVARIRGRTESTRDREAADAIWIPVVSPDRDACSSPEAQNDAMRYVTEMGLGEASGIDRRFGPMADDGQQAPVFDPSGAMDQGVTSSREYQAEAARRTMGNKNVQGRYISFYRVRRAGIA